MSLSVVYLDRSGARGVLCLLMYLTPNGIVDFSKSVFIVVRRYDHQPLDFQIPNNTYITLGYDVEDDGLIQQRGSLYPARREDLVVGNDIGILTS